MLMCKEQKNPIMFEGREVKVNDKVLNAHYVLCGLPVDDLSVKIYIHLSLGDNYPELIKTRTNEELAQLVEKGVKREFLDISDEKTWESVEG